MDHPADAVEPRLRPWRTVAVVASAIAAVELVLLLAAGTVLLGRSLLPTTTPTASAKQKQHKPKRQARVPAADRAGTVNRARRTPRIQPIGAAKLPRRRVTVLVLNGNGRQGAAGVEATRIRSRGYRVSAIANARRMDYSRSLVMYRPGFRAEGARLARDMRIKTFVPLDGLRARDLQGSHLALIVGSS